MTNDGEPSTTPRTIETEYPSWEEIAEVVGISAQTLRKDIDLQYWSDEPDLQDTALPAYCNTRAVYAMYELRPTKLTGQLFVQCMKEYFENWEEQHYQRLGRAEQREMITTLRDKGIHPVRGSTIREMLYEIMQGEWVSSARKQSSKEPEAVLLKTGRGDRKGKKPQTAEPDETLPQLEAAARHPSLLSAPTHDARTNNHQTPAQIHQPQVHRTNTPLPQGTAYTIELPYQDTQVPSYYGGDNRTQHLHEEQYQQQGYTYNQSYNPYSLPPVQEQRSERLPPEKLVQFQKAWRRENNYTGRPYDILADKARIFIELCRRLDIYEAQFPNVFPDILADRANAYYMHNIGPGHSWKQLYEKLDSHFNTRVNHNQYWTDWTTMSFARSKQENPDKTPHEVLEIMIDKLTLAQRALGPDFKGDVPLHTAIVRACRGQPELEQAMFSIKPTTEALYSDLRSALQISIDRQNNQYLQDQAESYYTDRRYSPSPRARNFSRGNRGNRPSQFSQRTGLFPARNRPQGRPLNQAKKRCFVCHKEGCWSSNHPRTDVTRAKRQYAASHETFYNSAPTQEDISAYVTNFEGVATDSYEDDNDKEQDEDPEEDEEEWEYGNEAVQYLTETSYLHRTTGEDIYNTQPREQVDQFILDGRYSTSYQGELWDTGAASVSTVGKAQLEAYIRENPRTKVNWTPSQANISFGGQNPKGSLGTVRIQNPIGTVTYHILDTPTPFLLSLADADRLGAYFNNVLDVIVRSDKTTIPVVRKWGHPFFNVSLREAASFFTETELRRLHRRFGHPRTERLHTMLKEAGHDINASALKQIEKFCHFCQSHEKGPQRFKFSIKDNLYFNYEIVIDVVRIGNRDVLHVIDTDTSFQAATFLKSMSARDTWEALCKCWINTYQGPPDYVVHDPGTNFASEEFKSRARIIGTECRQMPVEAHWTVGKVERAHAPLKRVYNILRAELQSSVDDEAILQMAIKALNDTAGPNGLVPTLLVFGAYPRIATDSPPSPDLVARANAIRKAMKALQNERAKNNVNRALNTRNGPSSHEVLQLPLNSEIMVWREKKGWTGPYELKGISGHNIIIELENGPVTFRCTQAKPYHRLQETDVRDEGDQDLAPVRTEPLKTRKRGRPKKSRQAEKKKEEQEEEEEGREGGEEEEEGGGEEEGEEGEQEEEQEGGEREQGRGEKEQEEGGEEEQETPVRTGNTRKRGRPRKNQQIHHEKDNTQGKERRTRTVRRNIDAFLTQKEKDDYQLARQLREEGTITTQGAPFEESDRAEMESLLQNGTFEILRINPRKEYGRIFNLRLVREVKGRTTQPYEKSRLVLAGHSDKGKEEILTQSPTIQRMSQRLLLALGVSLIASHGMQCELRDITQAYVQSKDKLLRTIYAKPPKELLHTFPPHTILRVVRPLYGAAESGLYWFKTYHNHHKDKLRMRVSTYDPCLLITDQGKDTFGITGLQTDDTISIATPEFSKKEEEELRKAEFRAKPKTVLGTNMPIEFNGARIEIAQSKIRLMQKGQSAYLRTINPDDEDAAHQYIVQRARGAYIASVCQPEAVFDLSTAAQTTEPTKEDIAALNVRLQWQMDNPTRGLTFIPLQLNRTKLFIFTDGSFANNKDLSSQLGFIIVMATEQRTEDKSTFEICGNIVHWNSIKCKRVTRSVLASELYGMVTGFDNAIALSTTLQQITQTLQLPRIPVIVCTDSRSLYECLVKLGTTHEKRLMIDIMSLRESYENREIAEVRWINGKDNPADACTKKTPNTALERLVSTNQLSIKIEAFVDRTQAVRNIKE